MHNIESMEAIEIIRDTANRDYLTGLYNRQYFYQIASQRIEQCQQNNTEYALGIVEIDDFREFNNVYSEYGDGVLVRFANLMANEFRIYLTARLNATQLVAFVWGLSKDECDGRMNNFRERVKDEVIETGQSSHRLSVSIGFCHTDKNSLREMLEQCDQLILRAQEAGKNLVLFD